MSHVRVHVVAESSAAATVTWYSNMPCVAISLVLAVDNMYLLRPHYTPDQNNVTPKNSDPNEMHVLHDPPESPRYPVGVMLSQNYLINV